jgi:hypothetical protein
MNRKKTMRDVRAEHGIDVDACDAAFRTQQTTEILATCETIDDVANLSYRLRNEISAVATARKKEINVALDAPYLDELKRWKPNDLVYFGKPETLLHMRVGGKSTTCKKAIVYKVTRGKKPNVWLVVPKGHGNYPGARYGHGGKTLRNYSLRELRKLEISRTEVAYRKKESTK